MPARFPHERPICRYRATVRDCVEKFDMHLSVVIEGTTPNEAQGRPQSSPHVAPFDRTARFGRAPWHRVTRGRKHFLGHQSGSMRREPDLTLTASRRCGDRSRWMVSAHGFLAKPRNATRQVVVRFRALHC